MSDDATRLAEEFWALQLRANPVSATLLGCHEHDDAMPDISEDAEAAVAESLEAIAARAQDVLDTGPAPADRVTLDVLAATARGAAAELTAAELEYTVAPTISGAHARLFEDIPNIRLTTAEQAEALLARYKKVPAYLEQAAERLRAGVARSRPPVARGVEQSVAQLDAYLASDLDTDGFLQPDAPDGWAGAGAWHDTRRAVVADHVRPALARYRDVLLHEVLPHARPPGRSGLCWLPGGEQAYASLVAARTTVETGPEELHAIGWESIESLRVEYRTLGESVFGTGEVAQVFHRLRTDEALRFRTGAEIRAHAETALGRAEEAVASWFGTLPSTPCVVSPMPEEAGPDGTIALYLPPAADGSRPGTYFVNTHSPETKYRHEADVLAFHEAVPGHHTQIALAQERAELPEFRRHITPIAYVEGWALYTERLAEEMGLYLDDTSRLGVASFDSWRSGRLVVDTGLHHLGWSRRQAIDHLLEHSPLAPDNVENEVDRYIAWPGQALAYKVGQRAILRLRAHAEHRLGTRFALPAFHDLVLSCGAVPLPTLTRLVEDWVDASA